MDAAAEIKKNLISRIKNSTDLNFLNALQAIFDSSEQTLYPLTPEQESSIKKGRQDIKEGRSHSNDEVISEMREWLKKK